MTCCSVQLLYWCCLHYHSQLYIGRLASKGL